MSYVCADCIKERWLADYIRTNANQSKMGILLARHQTLQSRLISTDIIDHIRERIGCIYEDPANSVGYESAEGGYQLSTMDTYEILDDVGLSVDHDNLREELVDGVGRSEWVRRISVFASGRRCSSNELGVVCRDRQAQGSVPHVPIEQHDEFHLREGLELSEVLRSTLGDAFLRYDLLSVLKAGTSQTESGCMRLIARLRTHCLPWARRRSRRRGYSNRMSPAGISMFYGAIDEETARAKRPCRRGWRAGRCDDRSFRTR